MAQAQTPAPIDLAITGKYLLVPVQSPSTGYRGNTVQVEVDGVVAYKFGVFLAPSEETVDAWGCIDVSEYVGKKAQITSDSGPEDRWQGASALIKSSDEIKSSVPTYTEKGRPQFHFSQRVGSNNDPNGMVYSDGLYHLSWQYNPMISSKKGNWNSAWQRLWISTRMVARPKVGSVHVDTSGTATTGSRLAFSKYICRPPLTETLVTPKF